MSEKIAETIAEIIDKLAGKGSDLILTFEDLTIDFAGKPVKITGKIKLDVHYVKEEKE